MKKGRCSPHDLMRKAHLTGEANYSISFGRKITGREEGKALCACVLFWVFFDQFPKTYGLENLKASKEML